jgi:hypothetical protein
MQTTKQNNSRRDFIKKLSVFGGATAISGSSPLLANQLLDKNETSKNGKHLTITSKPKELYFSPLSTIKINTSQKGLVKVYDSEGSLYYTSDVNNAFSFVIGGSLGVHCVFLEDKKGKVLDLAMYNVNCKTTIKDKGGKYNDLLWTLYYTMIGEWGREANILNYNNQFYHVFVSWLRDHVHTMKGMKYFYPELKTGIDLYGDSQREDGMIWDNYKTRNNEHNYWEQRFGYGDFIKIVDNNKHEFKRIPAENDVEYLFLEGIYYTWKATGDDEWMKSMLDKAVKAVEYTTTSPYRWSEKYQLLKRGFTIDTWDFQASEDADISTGEGNPPDAMVVKLGNTRFGIMYGDNTGMAAGCKYLAEMLRYAGRDSEAEKYDVLSKDIKKRLDDLSWNGDFYTHHVPEDPNINRDLGVDLSKQISLSNAYSLNRTLTHDQCKAIINTYRELKQRMPASSPGEWYTIYPPFEKGFGGHNSKWSYMNGGVTSIVAGELAHGAFENGFENYAVDILERVFNLSRKTQNYLHCTYRGKAAERPGTDFIPLSLENVANTDFYGTTNKQGVMPWTNEGKNDLHEFPVGKQVFHDVPFNVIDPAKNGRKACLGLSAAEGYAQSASIKVNKKAKCAYLLHTTGNSYYAGCVTFTYKDGSSHSEHIASGKIMNWWFPSDPAKKGKQIPKTKLAWTGKNDVCIHIGVMMYGMNNPYPDKIIESIEFEGPSDHSKYMVLGVTLADQPAFFEPSMVSSGIPDNWGAAAVVYALIEGLAGIKDTGVAYDKALLAPRWAAAGENEVNATAKYEASNGYLTYQYKKTGNNLIITFTGSSETTDIKILLPKNKKAGEATLNNKTTNIKTETIESSNYACLTVNNKGIHQINIQLI